MVPPEKVSRKPRWDEHFEQFIRRAFAESLAGPAHTFNRCTLIYHFCARIGYCPV
jgi:hypothetical protein